MIIHNKPARLVSTKPTYGISLFNARAALRVFWQFLAPRHIVHHADIASQTRGKIITEADMIDCDAILLLGSNDLTPVQQTADLYSKIARVNPSIKIVACGKGGHLTVPGKLLVPTEAECYAEELIGLGIPAEAIIIEKDSTNTGQNIINAQKKLRSIGIYARRVVLVQTPAAQLRANLVFERQWASDWEYYISFPPALPNIRQLSLPSLIFYLAYALREAATTVNYSYNPAYDFQTREMPPPAIINTLLQRFNSSPRRSPRILPANYFLPDNLERVSAFFRRRFAAIEESFRDKFEKFEI